ncbi:hypothetical protein HMN09_01350400 [Mycena chlorophos]|uniref:DUF6534 domain-containing protein n=1 Tax=Mycena chlorophos TaxID=658473 RepID=A0A8H6RWE5_MYCCL|nr:hypothetical protein HMN09_01350400 [Mycena chlorophos]
MASSAPSSLPASFAAPDSTLGAFLVGVLCSVMLFGVVTNQCYAYSSRFSTDSGKLKCLVAGVWLCELAHVICITHALYILVITDFANPENIANIPPSLGASTVFNAIIALGVQGFFSFRIYRLSKSLVVPFISWTLSFLFLVASVAVFALATILNLTKFEEEYGWLLDTTWSIAAANDLLIAVTLVVQFYWWRQRDSEKTTTVLVDKLITWTIETGLVTSAAALLNLLCFMLMKTNFVWIAWYVVTARLYSNSFLASLNSRETLRMMNPTDVYTNRPSRSRTQAPKKSCTCQYVSHAEYGDEKRESDSDSTIRNNFYPTTAYARTDDEHPFDMPIPSPTRTIMPISREPRSTSNTSFVDVPARSWAAMSARTRTPLQQPPSANPLLRAPIPAALRENELENEPVYVVQGEAF